jgi:hypothetical protein
MLFTRYLKFTLQWSSRETSAAAGRPELKNTIINTESRIFNHLNFLHSLIQFSNQDLSGRENMFLFGSGSFLCQANGKNIWKLAKFRQIYIYDQWDTMAY